MFLTGVSPLDTQKYGPLVSMQCGGKLCFYPKRNTTLLISHVKLPPVKICLSVCTAQPC